MEPQHGQSRLGSVLQERRETLGLSRHEVARRTAIDRTAIIRIESGAIRQPDPAKLARLAKVLDLPLSELYVLAGYPQDQLPSFQPYLRSRYGKLPRAAVEELDRHFQDIAEEYGIDPNGPADGEDERSG